MLRPSTASTTMTIATAKNTKNNIFAIFEAPDSIFLKPNKPAAIDIKKKTKA